MSSPTVRYDLRVVSRVRNPLKKKQQSEVFCKLKVMLQKSRML